MYQGRGTRGALTVGSNRDHCDMDIWPTPGVTGQRLLDVLDFLNLSAVNFAAGVHDPYGMVSAYLKWGIEGQRMAHGTLATSDLERLVLTRRYWAVAQNPAHTAETNAAIGEEMTTRRNDLEAARDALRKTLDSWAPMPGYEPSVLVIPDTNVLMKRDHRSADFDWHGLVSDCVRTMTPITVVVPIAVIDELDNLKRGNSETRTNARHALKYLSHHLGTDPTHWAYLKPPTTDRGPVSLRVLFDPSAHIRLAIMDDEIIDRAAAIGSLLGRHTVFVTYDTAAAFRASAAGLKVQLLEDPEVQ